VKKRITSEYSDEDNVSATIFQL